MYHNKTIFFSKERKLLKVLICTDGLCLFSVVKKNLKGLGTFTIGSCNIVVFMGDGCNDENDTGIDIYNK